MIDLPEMDAKRACYFLRRFKNDEKMLGPNEQLALDYAIAALSQQNAERQDYLILREMHDMQFELFQFFNAHRTAGTLNTALDEFWKDFSKNLSKVKESSRTKGICVCCGKPDSPRDLGSGGPYRCSDCIVF